MILPKSVLKTISVELRTKTDKQLEILYNLYNSQLSRLSDRDYEYCSKPIKQKLELVEQEIYLRSAVKSQQVTQ